MTQAERDEYANSKTCEECGLPIAACNKIASQRIEIARLTSDLNVALDRLRHLEDVSCNQQNDVRRLTAENENLRRWKALDKPVSAAMEIANSHLAPLQAEISRLTALAYAPDGKEMRSALFEEAAKRGAAEAERDALRAALAGILPYAKLVINSTDSQHDRDRLRAAESALNE